VLSATLSDTEDPQQAVADVKRAGEAVKAVFGKSRKEFK
jgi:hypothetical protein